MARPTPSSDDGSPARVIATMVGIVGILLLGSLAWSAVGALLSAAGAAGTALMAPRTPLATLEPPVAATPTTVEVGTPTTAQVATPPAVQTPQPTLAPAATPTEPAPATPTPPPATRNPWILLPQPEPGSHVAPGALVVEARGRGDAPISSIRLELDGAAIPVALEQRSESTWRGSATIRVGAGQHAVRAVVTDADGRSGSFRWTFAAGP